MPKLTDLTLKALKPKQTSYLKNDGNGLNIKVYPNGRMQWILRKSSNGKATQIILGVYPDMSLKQAREKASVESANFTDSRCAISPKTSMTISELFQEWLSNKTELRASSVLKYNMVFNHLECLKNRTIDSVTPFEVKRLADNISKVAPSLAAIAVNIIATIEIYANALGLVETPKLQFVAKTIKPHRHQHYRSIHYEELPRIFEIASQCKSRRKDYYCYLLFLGLLTLLRTNEIQNLKKTWIDFNDKVIYLPSTIMKAKREHTVPICSQLDYLLEKFSNNDLIAAHNISDNNLKGRYSVAFKTMKLMPLITPHGMRSLARTWLADNDFNFAASEMCLAHKIENATQQAYQRSDYLKQRRDIMQQWGDYVQKCAQPYLPEFFK